MALIIDCVDIIDYDNFLLERGVALAESPYIVPEEANTVVTNSIDE